MMCRRSIPHSARRAIGLTGAVVALALQATAHAGLFDDEEARRAILELRQRIEATRQASDAGLKRQSEAQAETARRSADDSAQLRRSLLELQNQIEAVRAEFARLTGQNEQVLREMADLQRRQKDLAQGQSDLGRTVDDRVRQLEPVKVTVDAREIMVEPAERRAFDAALASFRAGDFVGSQDAFISLLARYPRSGYLPSALFWLGNAQYATRDYKEAITNFRTMLQGAPEHVRAAEAMLSIANCQIELKDPRGARKTLEDLAKAYPQSEAAQAGRERLARLR
ncbi:MAG: tol-pal system protein YbgF [Burkholderiaceae bacterium]